MQRTHIFERRAANWFAARSWIDPRLERRRSPIQGSGLFATAPIRVGEVVTIWGGSIFTGADLRTGVARLNSCVQVAEGFHLGSPKQLAENLDEYMNHSCDPNVWLVDEVTLVARHDIARGDELTIDYALWETDATWAMDCTCGSPLCRRVVSGQDWKRPDLQARYGAHFSPYVRRRIARLRGWR
jgi:uncharacterized protein